MGKEEVQIVVSAKDLATSALTKIGGVLAATFSVAAIAAFGKAAVDSASEQEQAEIRRAQALGRTSQALDNQAAALQKTTKFADEQIIDAQASLAMFTKNETQIKQLTQATIDFAAAKKMDLASAADIVGKSLGGEVSMLGRYGVATEGAAGSAERFTSIIQGLGSHFGGQAEAQANTYSGSVVKLKHNFDEFLESVGGVIVRNPVVMSAMKLLSGAFENLSGWVQKNQVFLMELVQGGIAVVIRGIGLAIQVINVFSTVWYGLETVANSAVYAIVGGLELLITPFAFITAKLKEYGIIETDYLADVKQGLTDYRQFVGDTVKSSANDFAESFKSYGKTWEYWNGLADNITNVEMKPTKIEDAITPQTPEMPAPDVNPAVEALSYYDQALGEHMVALFRLNEMQENLSGNLANAAFGWDNTARATGGASVLIAGYEGVMTRAAQGRANVVNAANKAMETQLMRLVETHKFSVGEIGKALLQSVKMELVAVAAKAAVQGLYFTALGLAASTPWGAATLGPPSMFFGAAGQMFAIAGASMAGAAAMNAVVGPSGETSSSGAPGSSPSNPSYTSGVPEPSAAQQGGAAVTHVTVNVYNPLSNQNWDEVFELDIAPAIARAQLRGVMA